MMRMSRGHIVKEESSIIPQSEKGTIVQEQTSVVTKFNEGTDHSLHQVIAPNLASPIQHNLKTNPYISRQNLLIKGT